ncbi:MAG: hypothetical protein WCI97_02885 [Bacteroidota bacterium]
MKLKFILTVLIIAISQIAFAKPPCAVTITTVPTPATICNGQSITLTA